MNNNMEKTIHLIGHGKQQAKMASEINIGDNLMWNYGTTSKVVGIENKTDKMISIVEEYMDGKRYIRRLRKDRLVAYV